MHGRAARRLPLLAPLQRCISAIPRERYRAVSGRAAAAAAGACALGTAAAAHASPASAEAPKTSWLPAKPGGGEKVRVPPRDPQGRPRVVFQGELGAYGETAIVTHFSQDAAIPVPCDDFETLIESVRSGTVERGCIPVENSLAGTIHKNYDLLLAHEDLHIVGEVSIPISHCLMANKGVTLGEVKRVLSHPVALDQCETFIRNHQLQKEITYDTAGSAKMLSESGERDAAAIAGVTAAQRYGLDIVARGVQDETNNFTRFLIISRTPAQPTHSADGAVRTTMLLGLPNVTGSLVHALTIFSMRGLGLSKLESRPLPSGKLGDSVRAVFHTQHTHEFPTMFIVDVIGSTADRAMQNAMRHLHEEQVFVRILGSYEISASASDSRHN